MKKLLTLAATLAVLTTHVTAVAQADALSFAQAARHHCGGDISRLCRSVFPGGGRIGQCLIDQKNRLSPGCHDFVAKGQSASRVLFACETDAQRICSGVPPGQGRIVDCLTNNRKNISRSCARALDRAEAMLRR